jgi:cytochrome c oxidase subunit 4
MTTPAPGLLPGELKPHPTPVQYVMVAVVLVVITAIEIATSYSEGTLPDGLIVVLLLIMAFVKFSLVAAWYMHLRTDAPVFRRFFMLGAGAAILLYLIVLTTLHALS